MGLLKALKDDETDIWVFRRRHFGDDWEITEWEYLGEEGELVATFVRADKKGQEKACGYFAANGSYDRPSKGKKRSRPLYNLMKLPVGREI